MIEQGVKVLIGTAFYVAILWVAQRNPRAAGMMLTFPTLNGLVLLMAGPDAIENAASAMLLMPPINAALWTFYLAGFRRLVDRGFAPASASALLIAIGAGGWLAFAGAITAGRWGVPTDWQLVYVLATLVTGTLLTLALRSRSEAPAAGAAAAPQSLAMLVSRYRDRIAIFALMLAAIAVIDRMGASPALLGAMAGAPLVAMFGMQTMAADRTTPLSNRRASFAAMASGLWLGPGIAVVFVVCLSQMLAMLSAVAVGLPYHIWAAVFLIAGWALCILAIWSLAAVLHPNRRT